MDKRAEEIAKRLEANIDLAVSQAVADLQGVDSYEAAEALYKRLDDRLASSILLKVRR